MSPDDDALAGQARALLAAHRAVEALPDDVRARVWARVEDTTGAAATPVRGRATPASRSSVRHTRWVAAGCAAAAALALIWWARDRVERVDPDAHSSAVYGQREAPTGGTSHEAELREPTPREPTPRASEADTSRAEAPPALAPTSALPPTLPPASALPPAPPRPLPRTSPRDAEVDGLADETELLRAAQAALARGDGKRALALLEGGERRFGNGVLKEERAALRVLALCDIGLGARARREATAFAAAHPRSPLLARVQSACVDPPASP